MARFRDPLRANKLDDGFADIPYGDFAPRLLDGREQALVPLLGAGASRSSASPEEPAASGVDSSLLQELGARLEVRTEDAWLFLEIARAVLRRLNDRDDATSHEPAYDAVRRSTAAPSAAELAQALAERSGYDYFGRAKRRVIDLTNRRDWDDRKLTRLLTALARLTAIGSPGPPLLDASIYFADRKRREDFWSNLHELFRDKRDITATHSMVATAARRYIEHHRDDVTAADYLIITTNYDCLLEHALDAQDVPYYVLTVPNREPLAVDLRFSANARNYLGISTDQFERMVNGATRDGDRLKTTLQFSGLTRKSRPLVTVYKIHGSLHADATPASDGVVITHDDYVTFISLPGFIPAYIRDRLPGLGLLVLGYSFTDWNVRSLYRGVSMLRPARQSRQTLDYAVLLGPSPYEVGFFDRNSIDIFDTSLDTFCERMQAARS